MRYTVNGELPYYASIADARKAAIESGDDLDKQHDDYLLIAAIFDDEFNIKGMVMKKGQDYIYQGQGEKTVSMLNMDGSIRTAYELRISETKEPVFYLVDDHGHDIPFDNMKDLCITFNTICNKWRMEGHMRILDKDKNLIGTVFAHKGVRFCYYEKKVREIKPNGVFGKVRKDYEVDLTKNPVAVTKIMGVL